MQSTLLIEQLKNKETEKFDEFIASEKKIYNEEIMKNCAIINQEIALPINHKFSKSNTHIKLTNNVMEIEKIKICTPKNNNKSRAISTEKIEKTNSKNYTLMN